MNMKYQQWLDCPGMNEELLSQLKAMNEEQISDSFYRELAFGTGGHVIGTSKAQEMGQLQGAVGSLSLTVAGILTALLFPLVTTLF